MGGAAVQLLLHLDVVGVGLGDAGVVQGRGESGVPADGLVRGDGVGVVLPLLGQDGAGGAVHGDVPLGGAHPELHVVLQPAVVVVPLHPDGGGAGGGGASGGSRALFPVITLNSSLIEGDASTGFSVK